MKRLRKQLKKVEVEEDSEEKTLKIDDLREKVVYIKVEKSNIVLPQRREVHIGIERRKLD